MVAAEGWGEVSSFSMRYRVEVSSFSMWYRKNAYLSREIGFFFARGRFFAREIVFGNRGAPMN